MITFPDNFNLAKKASLDGRSGVWDSNAQRPYLTVTEANTSINSLQRYIGLTVYIKGVGDQMQEYWYRDGVNDEHLVQKNNWSIFTSAADGNVVIKGGQLIFGFLVKPVSGALTVFKIGTTPGGSEISGGPMSLAQGQTESVLNLKYFDTDTTIYFSGFSGISTVITILK